MADDLVEELLPQIDFTLPQRGLIGLALVPPLVFVCYKRTDPRKASDCGRELSTSIICKFFSLKNFVEAWVYSFMGARSTILDNS